MIEYWNKDRGESKTLLDVDPKKFSRYISDLLPTPYSPVQCQSVNINMYTVRSEHSSNEPNKQSNPWSAYSTYTSDRHQTT